jgi:filamentous hemagglutinin
MILLPISANQLQVDGTTNTSIDHARNNIPIVNIANPSTKGLSHNKFIHYNVNKEGLILNNSKKDSISTELSGYIQGNKNLTNSAKVILNEVSSINPTSLNGYTEIAGQKADMVIANPNGISINGAGFINTSSITLTTGRPTVLDGSIDSFNIVGGDITIDGDGLDTTAQDSTSIYSETLKINAKIYAKDLDIALGKNKIRANTKEIVKQGDSSKELLLDTSSLGGMYANKIKLVGTSKGVGVNLPPEVLASTGEITITNDGDILLGKLSAQKSIDVTTQSSIKTTKDIHSQDSTNLIASKDIVVEDGLVSAKNKVYIKSDKLINKSDILAGFDRFAGALNSSGDLGIDTDELENRGTIQSSSLLYISSRVLDNYGDIISNNILTITNQESIKNRGTIHSNKDINISSSIGYLYNEQNISAGDTLRIYTSDINTTGGVFSGANVDINSSGFHISNTDILATTDMNITTINLVNNSGTIDSDGNLRLITNRLTNKNIVIADDLVDVNATDIYNNSADSKILSLGKIDIEANTLTNEDGNITSYKDQVLTINSTLNNSRGFIYSQEDMIISVPYLNNILSSTIGSKRDLTLDAKEYITNSSDIISGGLLSILTEGRLTNSATISTGGEINIEAAFLINHHTISGGSGTSKITTTGSITNRSRISSKNSLEVSGGDVVNDGYFNSGDGLSITSNNLTNNMTLFSGGDMNLYTKYTLKNSEDANIFAMDNLKLAANTSNAKTNSIINDRGVIQSYYGDIDVYAKTLNNKAGQAVIESRVVKSSSVTLYKSDEGFSDIANYYFHGMEGGYNGSPGLRYYNTVKNQLEQEKINNGEYYNKIGFVGYGNFTYSFTSNFCNSDGCYINGIFYSNNQLIEKNEIQGEDIYYTVKYQDRSQYADSIKKYFIGLTDDDIGRAVTDYYKEKFNLDISYREYYRTIFERAKHYYIDIDARPQEERRIVTNTIKEDRYLSRPTKKAELKSGSSINLYVDNLTNYHSDITASKDINFKTSGASINNRADTLYRRTETGGRYRYCYNDCSGWHSPDYTWGTLPTTTSTEVLSQTYSTIQAGRDISGHIDKVTNQVSQRATIASSTKKSVDISNRTESRSIQSSSLSNKKGLARLDIELPKSNYSLFVLSKPDSKYLIETNPEFTIYENFISSDYLLRHVDYDLDKKIKLVGDAFYEAKLIGDSIYKQTGRSYLYSDITDDQEQYKRLMDSAIAQKEELGLIPGVSLSKEQVANLNRDIVWMEEKFVNGQRVLAPTLYIANLDQVKLQGGAIVANNDINLKVNNLQNRGELVAGGSIYIDSSDTIKNQGGIIKAKEGLSLLANSSIDNISAQIEGGDVTLYSRLGTINNIRFEKSMDFSRLGGIDRKKSIGGSSSIVAKNTLKLDAYRNFINQGSSIKAKDMMIKASKVDIKTTAQEMEYFSGRGGNYVKESSTSYLRSDIQADSISINSSGTTSISGSSIEARGDIKVEAKKIDIKAVNDLSYQESKTSSKGFLSKKSTTTKKATSRNIASTLSGANITLTTTKEDIDITGSSLVADNQLKLDSAKDIDIKAGYDGSFDESHTKKSGWFSGGSIYSKSEDLKGELTKSSVSSTLQAGSVDIVSNDKLTLEGSDIEVRDYLNAQASDIDIKASTNIKKTYSKHEELKVGLGDVANSVINPVSSMEFKDGKASLTIARATYDKVDKVVDSTTLTGSNIKAGSSVNLRAKSTDSKKGDINIQASSIEAEGDIDLEATNNITIKEAKESRKTDTKESHAKAELNIVIKNEYEQIRHSVDNLKRAKESLQKAKADYEKYKEDVKDQESKLAKLQEQYKNNQGFIEKEDVEELRELIDDLKEDREYYQTNIALAASSVATSTTALASQTSKAAQSSSTYGFNIGLELDIDSIESALNEYESRSVGSSLKANNIDITAGNKATIQGSKVEAKESIKLVAQDTTIRSSTDYSNSTTNSEHKNINYSIDLLSGGGPSISASQDRSSFYSKKTTHTSSQLKANNIDITTKERTTIAGANIHSNEQININTKELEVSSVQDRVKQQSQRDGESIGVGSSGLNQIGINNANSKTTQKETILTSITGKRVDIDVKDSIRLYGAMIASIDKDGSDNKNLTLKTDTLEVSSKNNTYQSNTKSSSINLSGSTENAKVSNIGVEYTNSKTNTKTKTLATLGEGNIQITNKDDSDIKMLNRDIKNNEVDIYNIKSHKGLKGEIDTRLFTKEGRKEIKDEIITSTAITNALEQIATTNKAELTDFFKETKKSIDVYEGMKRELQNNPQLAAQLQDPNLTPKEKQEMLREVAITVMVELGYRPKQTKLISTDEIGANDTQVKGHYNTDTDSSYINDKYNDSTIELVETVGHEMTHAMDNQDGILILNDADQNNYANNFGEDLSFYTSNALDYTHDGSLASTNTHNQGRVTSYPSVFNDSTLVKNNREFATLDKSLGDDAIYMHGGKVVATDGINDGKVINLTVEEYLQFRDDNDLGRFGNIKIVDKEDTSKYKSVFNLNNKKDFERLREGTDMNYHGISFNSDIVFVNGMNNDEEAAQSIQSMIKQGFPNSQVGLINNETGKTVGVLDDVFEWLPNYLTTKDVLNAHMYQKLKPNTIVVTHSAGNEDIYKANEVNSLVNAKTPYKLISVGSPKSATKLKESTSGVGAIFIKQINHPNDPVANWFVNRDANYDMNYGLIDLIKNRDIPLKGDLDDNHPFKSYYQDVKKEIELSNTIDRLKMKLPSEKNEQ